MKGISLFSSLFALCALAIPPFAGPVPAGAPAIRMLAPGVISTEANEFGGAMTPDGQELYFSRSVPRSYMYAIFVSHKTPSGWSLPEVVPFSGRGRDFDPVLSPDGRTMVFISDRSVHGEPKHDYDIWMTQRSGKAWGVPKNLGAPVNSVSNDGMGNEWFASIAADGTLYFAADDRAGSGQMRIYLSRYQSGVYQTPEELGPEINADAFDGEPIIAPDRSFLLFAAFNHAGGYGNWDIYISRSLPGEKWSTPENLGPAVNTSVRDYSPRLEPDGHHLIFTSERFEPSSQPRAMTYRMYREAVHDILNGNGNLYEVDLNDLGLKTFPAPQDKAPSHP